MRYLLLIFLMIPTLLFGQPQGSDGGSNIQDLAGGGMFRTFNNRFKEVEGHPTLFEKYVPGKIYLKDGRNLVQALVNYDVMTDEVLVMRDKFEMVIQKHLVTKFVLLAGADSLFFVKVVTPEATRFVEILIDGPVQLYKANIKTLEGATHTGPYSSGDLNDKFEDSVQYYWQKKGGTGPLIQIKSKKMLLSGLQEAMGQDYSDFAKENKLSMKQENDLMKLVNHINRSQKR
jgi:hypothetical protein